jgi:plastocyanin
MRKPAFLSAVIVSATAALLACSSDTTSTGGAGTDAGTSSDSGGGKDSGGGGNDSGGGGNDAGSDAPVTLNGCTTFADHTAANDARTLDWDVTIASSPDRCMKIKAGQSVTWSGNFSTHPLAQAGGDTPSPIGNGTGTSKTIQFPNPGDYGYVCTVHSTMRGVIQVVP